MKSLFSWVLQKHGPLTFFLLLALLTGLYSFDKLPKDVYPESRFPRFQITAEGDVDSLENTELSITQPLERRLRTVPGVNNIVSTTERGTLSIDLFLNWNTDLREAYQQVQTKISDVRSIIPANVNLQILKISTSSYAMAEYGFWTDDVKQTELFSFLKYSVVPQLLGIDGIYQVKIKGGIEPQIWIELKPAVLAKYNLDPATIQEAIVKNNHFSFLGKVIKQKNFYLGFGGSQLTSIKKIKNIVVDNRMGMPIRIRDIAKIEKSHSHIRRLASIDGHKGVVLSILKQKNVDGLKLSVKIDSKFKEIQKHFQGKLNIIKWDLSDFVRSSLTSVFKSIAFGVLLIILIIYFFLGKIRYSMPILIMLPIIIILEFIVLRVFHQSINIMSLGGLAAALGILSDNATVLTENYIRQKEYSSGEYGFIESAVKIFPPMLSATLVSIVVFFPLVLLSGISGLFFKSLLFTLASTIVLSLLATIFITPIMIRYFIGFKKNDNKTIYPSKEDSIQQIQKSKQERKSIFYLRTLFERFFSFCMKHSEIVFIFLVLILLVSAFLFTKVPKGFMPESDEGKIVLDYVCPEILSLAEVDKELMGIEKIIHSFSAVDFFIRKTGTGIAFDFKPFNQGDFVIVLKQKRNKSIALTMNEMQKKIAEKYPKIETDLFQILPDRLGDLSGTRKPILINVLGNDAVENLKLAKLIKGKLKKIKGLNSVLLDMPEAGNEFRIKIHQDTANLLGLFTEDVSNYIKIALYGENVSYLPHGLQKIPIGLVFQKQFNRSLKELNILPVYTPNGGIIPLHKLADIKMEKHYPLINHIDGTPSISVSAEIYNRALSDVVHDIKTTLADIKTKSSAIMLSGDYKNQQKSFSELIMALLVGILLIFGLLLLIFKRYTTAIIVFVGIVSSVSFVILGLFITGTEFDVSSFTGMITIMGIIANNGILVMDFVEDFRMQGRDLKEVINKAISLRFRPVLITNLTTFAGFLPLALNLGGGGEILGPFAIAILFGLLGSVFFSLVLMPVFYYRLHKAEDFV